MCYNELLYTTVETKDVRFRLLIASVVGFCFEVFLTSSHNKLYTVYLFHVGIVW